MFEPVKCRVEGCRCGRMVPASGGWSFIGCFRKPYRGKWVREIEKCPAQIDAEAAQAGEGGQRKTASKGGLSHGVGSPTEPSPLSS